MKVDKLERLQYTVRSNALLREVIIFVSDKINSNLETEQNK